MLGFTTVLFVGAVVASTAWGPIQIWKLNLQDKDATLDFDKGAEFVIARAAFDQVYPRLAHIRNKLMKEHDTVKLEYRGGG